MRIDTDIVVVGSGCFGSLAALVAASCGRSVALVERGRHPRFAIGESSTPLANLLVEEIARESDLPWLATFSKWGPWRREHPRVRCGKKRGFTFLDHTRGGVFAARPDRADQFLVAASPHDAVADTQWFRADLDAHLVERALEAGVQFLDGLELTEVECSARGNTLAGRREGEPVELACDLVIDATGPRGFLWQRLGLGERALPGMPATQALFSHFTGVTPLVGSAAFPFDVGLPFPPDDAAVHHVIDGGWVWSLRFDHGVTSAGVVATPTLAAELGLEEGEPAWRRLLARQPTLHEFFGAAHAVEPFIHLPQVPFRTERAAGDGWIMLPSAATFADPLLSMGFPLALLGILRLGRILRQADPGARACDLAPALAQLGKLTLREADHGALLIAALHAQLGSFPRFRALARLYFAAVSFAESSIRLGRADPAAGFLGMEHPEFAAAFRALCTEALSLDPAAESRWLDDLRRATAPLDVIGLDLPDFESWIPVDLDVLLARGAKLGASDDEIRKMIRRCELSAAGDTG